MKLILHVGNHKTGSTAIQTAACQYEQELKKFSILYPKTGRIKGAHHEWALALKDSSVVGFEKKFSLEVLIKELKQEILGSPTNVVFLSSEEFSPLRTDELQKILPLLNLFDEIDLVIVLRNQIQHIESSYKFSVLWEPLAEKRYFKEYISAHTENEYHFFSTRVEKITSIINFSKIHVLDFSRITENGFLVNNFFSKIGFSGLKFNEIKNNQSLSRLGTLGLMLYNNGFNRSLSRDTYVSKLSNSFFEKESLYDAESFNFVFEYFFSDNQRLKENFGIDLNHSTPKTSCINFAGSYFRPRDIAELYMFNIS